MSFATLVDACRAGPPRLALVLGSGMGGVVDRWGRVVTVPFAEVPGLAEVGVGGHRGQVSIVRLSGKHVLVFEGRLHFYEGHPWERVEKPTRLAAALGVRAILHTNAAGGIRDDLAPGSLMTVIDHLEWTAPDGWRRASERSSPYSARMIEALTKAALQTGVDLKCGVYASVTGPSYETPAEIRALRAWGADAVGMSTAREVRVGEELGLECAAISCITNRAAGLIDRPLSHKEVLEVAARQNDRLGDLLERVI